MASNSSPLMSSSRRPANSSGRSRGVPFSLRFEYDPCRSGSPHGVRGAVHFFSAGFTAAPGAFALCAEAGTAASSAVATAIARVAMDLRLIQPPKGGLLLLPAMLLPGIFDVKRTSLLRQG